MHYDKDTKKITIIEGKELKKKEKIIKSYDEVLEDKEKLYKELGLNFKGEPIQDFDENDMDALVEKHKKMFEGFDNIEIDPTNIYTHSKDFFRVDIGLIIQRPPIFLRMRENDIEFLKYR
jgi:hypothetical protein